MLDTKSSQMTSPEIFEELDKRYSAFVFIGEDELCGKTTDPVPGITIETKGSFAHIMGLLHFAGLKVKQAFD